MGHCGRIFSWLRTTLPRIRAPQITTPFWCTTLVNVCDHFLRSQPPLTQIYSVDLLFAQGEGQEGEEPPGKQGGGAGSRA